MTIGGTKNVHVLAYLIRIYTNIGSKNELF